MSRIFVGTSGWAYPSWRAHLYGKRPMRDWLSIASREHASLEINGSFYRQIEPSTYARWRRDTPDGFRFALKGHRYVTHMKRLRDCEEPIERLRDQARHLGEKLSSVVWQLPSNFHCDLPRLERFLGALEAWPEARHAIEMRHQSWFHPEVAAALRVARTAIVISDAPDFPMWRAVSTDVVYVRLHGHTRKYESSYSSSNLERWATDVRRWHGEGREVHVYFDNDGSGHAIRNAKTFAEMIGVTAFPPPPSMPTS